MRVIIPERYENTLLRAYLSRELKLSTRLLTRLKKEERGIVLNGARVTVRALLHTGDVLELQTEDTPADRSGNVLPAPLPLCVLFEDGDVLLCDKPGNMPTHPSHGHFDDTLANAVAFRDRERTGAPGVFRPVNRLDRETSGVVLIARNQLSAARLSAALQAGEIRKTYLAVLDGVPDAPEGEIRTGIRRRGDSVIFREVCPEDAPGAALAVTRYRVLAEWESECSPPASPPRRLSLVEASPLTGRTHQLRVHFAHLGTPILADALYGHASPAIARQALHALSLTFPHPITSEVLTVRAPLPPDMRSLLPETVAAHAVSLI